MFHTCTWIDKGETPWCSTKTDENGNHVKGHWGNCGSSCPIGCQVIESASGEWKPCIFPFVRLRSDGKTHTKPFWNCADVNLDKPDGRLMCSTKTNSSTNIHIDGSGYFGICDEKHCPKMKGILLRYTLGYFSYI